jgi:ribosomal protein S18 acetylase RimI-like enzyme
MARSFFYLQDIAIDPAHQGQGVGTTIVRRLVAHVQATAPEQAFVGVFSAGGREPFYERFGFLEHESLTGMFQVVPVRGT